MKIMEIIFFKNQKKSSEQISKQIQKQFGTTQKEIQLNMMP